MHRSPIAIAACAVLAAASLLTTPALASAHPASTHITAAHRPTVRTVVRPVTQSGHAVPGYRIRTIKDAEPVDCSSPSPSLAAVDDGIIRCAPDAAGADACWPAAGPRHVLCLQDAEATVLVRFRTSGRIAHATALERRAPLNLRLDDGVYCGLRDGGAGTFLRQHRNWSVFYYCNHHQAAWAPLDSKRFGIHRHHPAWTVELARDNGKRDVHKVRVAQAWFVGTQS